MYILNVYLFRFYLWYCYFLQVKWGFKKETFGAWFTKLQKKKKIFLNIFFQNRIDPSYIFSLKEE